MIVLWAGLINWLVTTIITESTLFSPLRLWLIFRSTAIMTPDGLKHVGREAYSWPEDTTSADVDAAMANKIVHGRWKKPTQLLTCQLCTRVWIGFALALYLGGPIGGFFWVIANGLLYAAVGHLLYSLEALLAAIRARLEKP